MGILLNPELEDRIAAKVQSGRYGSPSEVVEEGLALLDARDGEPSATEQMDAAAISEWMIRLGETIPEEELSRIPTDLARNIDHYLYGAPRTSE